ncbi:hypothetical protein CC2G_008560 [Coprinopsis cinerea AmutBmut pab1-1]|nr:hypothetical protein CC2G_008560 [Coprinopsis cinerea AmutBmut pab1-1]
MSSPGIHQVNWDEYHRLFDWGELASSLTSILILSRLQSTLTGFVFQAITIHTFTVLILRWKPPKHIVKYLTAAVWVIVVLIELITFAVHPKDLMGPTGYWCWIPRTHTVAQVMAEYFWMWLIGLITLVLYTVGYFVLKRNPATTHEAEEMRSIARQLLWYPLVYLVCILPQSIARWLMFTNNPVPYEFTLLARSLFSLSGLFNVILFFTTRYDLVAGVSGAPQPQSTAGTVPTQAPNGAAGGNYYREKANGTLDSRSYPSSPLSPYATHDPLLSNLKPNYKQHGRLPHSPLLHHSYGQQESPSHANRQEINFGPHGIYSDAQHQPYEMGDRDRGSVIQVNEASWSKDPSSSTQRTLESYHDEDSDEMGIPPPAIRG